MFLKKAPIVEVILLTSRVNAARLGGVGADGECDRHARLQIGDGSSHPIHVYLGELGDHERLGSLSFRHGNAVRCNTGNSRNWDRGRRRGLLPGTSESQAL